MIIIMMMVMYGFIKENWSRSIFFFGGVSFWVFFGGMILLDKRQSGRMHGLGISVISLGSFELFPFFFFLFLFYTRLFFFSFFFRDRKDILYTFVTN